MYQPGTFVPGYEMQQGVGSPFIFCYDYSINSKEFSMIICTSWDWTRGWGFWINKKSNKG